MKKQLAAATDRRVHVYHPWCKLFVNVPHFQFSFYFPPAQLESLCAGENKRTLISDAPGTNDISSYFPHAVFLFKVTWCVLPTDNQIWTHMSTVIDSMNNNHTNQCQEDTSDLIVEWYETMHHLRYCSTVEISIKCIQNVNVPKRQVKVTIDLTIAHSADNWTSIKVHKSMVDWRFVN